MFVNVTLILYFSCRYQSASHSQKNSHSEEASRKRSMCVFLAAWRYLKLQGFCKDGTYIVGLVGKCLIWSEV